MQVTKEMIGILGDELYKLLPAGIARDDPRWSKASEIMLTRLFSNMWQPIETAPRDGTEFQARIPGHGQDNIIAWDYKFECWAFTREQEPPDCWTDGYCWESNEDFQPSVKPTHWKPMPQPPEKE